jgi:imidazolonepropionase-like amidohydrolase
VLVGASVVGLGRADVEVRAGRIAAIGAGLVAAGAVRVDVSGRFLAPAFIDSHVHLAYLPRADEMASGGVAAAVDLGAPLRFLAQTHHPLALRMSGPMITAVGGYPTDSWGRDGYGHEVRDGQEAAAAVDVLWAQGARVIKMALTGSRDLPEPVLRSAANRAHELGALVVVHALGEDGVRTAARIGADVLAHTPVEPLSTATLSDWKGRSVISTLRAFGGAPATLQNLRALRDAGATVLYGTDFGNTRTPGIDGAELALLERAGFGGEEILTMATSAPAARWGFERLGSIAVGQAASLIVLDADPAEAPATLARPLRVYIDGVEPVPAGG